MSNGGYINMEGSCDDCAIDCPAPSSPLCATCVHSSDLSAMSAIDNARVILAYAHSHYVVSDGHEGVLYNRPRWLASQLRAIAAYQPADETGEVGATSTAARLNELADFIAGKHDPI